MDVTEIEKICRACKSQCDQMRSIFDSKEVAGVECKLADIIMACASVSITNEDELPKSICELCLDRLYAAYSFKKQVENVDSSLRETFEIGKIKQEITIDDESSTPIIDFDGTYDNDLVKSESEDYNLTSFTCTTCTSHFTSYVALISHQRSHQPKKTYTRSRRKINKTYRCKLCFVSCSGMVSMRRHMLIHLKTKPHACKVCKRGFTNADNLFNHEKHCQGEKPNICPICNRGFKREDSLRVHMSEHEDQLMLDSMDDIDGYIELDEPENNCSPTGTKEMSPQEEDKEISVQEFLDPNIAINEIKMNVSNEDNSSEDSDYTNLKKLVKKKKKTYSCEICSKAFPRSYHLSRHMRSHSDEKPFQCEICEKNFTRKDHVLRHLRLHVEKEGETFPCDICPSVFMRKDLLNRHKATKHAVGERVIHEKKFQCDICDKLFTTEKYRDLHLKAHTEKDEMTRCKTCGIDFESRKELMRHLSLANDCSKKLLCSECGQRFIKESQLLIHLRRHRGEKPFKCTFCDKGFPRTTDLRAHEKCHTGEKNHLCIVCGKGFGRSHKLTLHMRTHTGEKPYACTMCTAAFTQSNDLKTHIRRHTGERYHCDLCPEAFLVGYMLKQHKKKVHGIEESPSQRPLAIISKNSMKTNLEDFQSKDSGETSSDFDLKTIKSDPT